MVEVVRLLRGNDSLDKHKIRGNDHLLLLKWSDFPGSRSFLLRIWSFLSCHQKIPFVFACLFQIIYKPLIKYYSYSNTSAIVYIDFDILIKELFLDEINRILWVYCHSNVYIFHISSLLILCILDGLSRSILDLDFVFILQKVSDKLASPSRSWSQCQLEELNQFES